MPKLAARWNKLTQLYQKEIWQPGQLNAPTPRAWIYATLRVLSITWTVFKETKAASRAAALSFSSLLGLGPLVALTVLVAGFALDKNDPNLAANTLSRLINFVAPQVGQYGKLPSHADRQKGAADTFAGPEEPATSNPAPVEKPVTAPASDGARSHAGSSKPPRTDIQLKPRLVRMMNNFISEGQSGSVGTL